MRKQLSNGNKFVYVLLFVLAVAFIGGGVLVCVKNDTYAKNGLKTQAKITKIERDKNYGFSGNGGTNWIVSVEFYVNGEKISGNLDTYTSSMYEGKDVGIYYMKDNPYDFRYADDGVVFPVLFFFVGVLLFALAIYFVIAEQKKKKIREFKKTATAVVAVVTEVNVNTHIIVDGKCKLTVRCRTATGEEYTASQYVANARNAAVGQNLTVYTDCYGKYVIDLDELCSPNVETAKHSSN